IGMGRAIGSYSIGLGYLNSDASRDMDRLLEEIQHLAVNYTQALSFLQQPELQSLRAPAAASSEPLERVLEIFEDEIIMASSYDDSWDSYFERLSAEMAKTHGFSEAILGYLEDALTQRLGEGKRAMLVLVSALAVILLLIVWLYLGFYMATRRTI